MVLYSGCVVNFGCGVVCLVVCFGLVFVDLLVELFVFVLVSGVVRLVLC